MFQLLRDIIQFEVCFIQLLECCKVSVYRYMYTHICLLISMYIYIDTSVCCMNCSDIKSVWYETIRFIIKSLSHLKKNGCVIEQDLDRLESSSGKERYEVEKGQVEVFSLEKRRLRGGFVNAR